MSTVEIFKFISLFLLWTLMVYWMHRLARIKSQYNFLYKLHLAHHKINYQKEANLKFRWYYLFFYFGSIRASLDVFFMLTIPAFLIYLIDSRVGIFILIFHYLYEVFLSEGLLDHNPKITGRITHFFSWGKYHLTHHKKWGYNFSLMITIWDWVFRTQTSKD